MKKLVCEMCDSTDFVKQDGMFVCQGCGMKYSVEDAKKMMRDETLGNQGAAAKESSASTENSLQIARRAKQLEDWNATKKHYSEVALSDPTNTEAVFYSAYASAKLARIAGGQQNVEAAEKTLINCFPFIKEEFERLNTEEAETFIKSISTDLVKLTNTTIEGGARDFSYQEKITLLFEFVEIVESLHKNNASAALLYTLEECYSQIRFARDIAKAGNLLPFYFKTGENAAEKLESIRAELVQADPSYEPPKPVKSGCYVATAVYGSYNCPEVWTLRRYRDNTLAETWYGRAFIKTYYAISPALVKWFGHTEWFKKMWKGKLDRMVAKLQASGVESTPYEDRCW